MTAAPAHTRASAALWHLARAEAQGQIAENWTAAAEGLRISSPHRASRYQQCARFALDLMREHVALAEAIVAGVSALPASPQP